MRRRHCGVTSRGVIDRRRNPRISTPDAGPAGVLEISMIPRQHPHTALLQQCRIPAEAPSQPRTSAWTYLLRHWPIRPEVLERVLDLLVRAATSHAARLISMTAHTGGIMFRSVTSRVGIEQRAVLVDVLTIHWSVIAGDHMTVLVGTVRYTTTLRRTNTGLRGNRTGLQQLSAAQLQGMIIHKGVRTTLGEVCYQSRFKRLW